MSPRRPEDSLCGAVLGGTYEITRPLGEGGMGTVYEAIHVRLRQKRFAVKLLQRHLPDTPELLLRLRREAEVVTEIGHPNIAEVVDFNVTEDGKPYLVMELLEGETLEQRIERQGPLAPAEAAVVMQQVASAIQAAHERDIIHRDLKPANLFLVRDPEQPIRVKVLDFGLAKVLGAASQLTQANVIMGSIHFMAPEQARPGTEVIDHRADIFSLGAVLFSVVTGAPPLDAPTLAQLVDRVCSEEPPLLSSLAPQVPPAWDGIVARAMAKRREDRYPNARDFARDLLTALAQQELAQTRAIEAPRRSQRPILLLALTVLLLAGAVFATSYWLGRGPSGPDVSSRSRVADATAARTTAAPAPDLPVAGAGDPGDPAAPDQRRGSSALAEGRDAAPQRPGSAGDEPRGRTARSQTEARTGTLRVGVQWPPGAPQQPADVYLDGRLVDQTPWRGEVPAGKHVVRVTREGFKDFRRSVTVRSGEKLIISAPLEPRSR